jgi:hypothetical protein
MWHPNGDFVTNCRQKAPPERVASPARRNAGAHAPGLLPAEMNGVMTAGSSRPNGSGRLSVPAAAECFALLKHGVHPRQQLVRVERLDEEILGAGVEALVAV